MAGRYAQFAVGTLVASVRWPVLVLLIGAGLAASASSQVLVLRFDGEASGDRFAHSVARLDDVDGDGRPEVVVGAPGASMGGLASAGSTYVFTSTGGLLWRHDGTEAGAELGTSVAGGGDLTGDGIPDVIMGTPFADAAPLEDGGGVVTASGASGQLVWQYLDSWGGNALRTGWSVASLADVDGDDLSEVIVGSPSDIDCPFGVCPELHNGIARLLAGSDGSEIKQYGLGDTEMGASVAAIADLNGDGFQDVLIGAPASELPGNPGVVRAFPGGGPSAAPMPEVPLFAIPGVASGARFGSAVVATPDIDADGQADIFVGAPGTDVDSLVDAGAVRLISSATQLELWRADGTEAGGEFGSSVAALGDVDDDGVPDVVVGAPLSDPGGLIDAGSAFVLSGATGSVLFRIDGAAPGERLGTSMAGLGDVTGDGHPDVVVGAPGAGTDAVPDAGAAFLFSLVPVAATGPGGRHPGSVGVFTVHRSGAQPEDGGTFFTILSVTNTATDPATPADPGGSTNVRYEYVNVVPDPADPFVPLACSTFDRVEFLTPADTLSVLTSCHNATAPGGQQGYVVVSAEDPSLFGTPWSHNHLVGSELVVTGSGGMYSLNMVSLPSPVADGDPTDLPDVAGNPPNGRLDFNGVEYAALPDELLIDSFVALAGSQLALLNLTGGAKAVNTVKLTVWNDDEFPLSATRAFACWFDQPLVAVSPLFSEGFLANNTPNDPQELDVNCDGLGDFETGWADNGAFLKP
jgi:hypothetical protein